MAQIEILWELPPLPFVYTPLDEPTNPDPLPDFLNFTLAVDTTSGRVYQVANDELTAALDRAYTEGSELTGQMDEEGIGSEYAGDFMSFLDSVVGEGGYEEKRVLEIGCGSGYLLHQLHQRGAQVRGVDPGAFADVGSAKYGIQIDRGFFPETEVGGDYDIVILYMLLEHVPDPHTLLCEVNQRVRAGGQVVIAVPDAEPYIANGELSMLFHEHFSYFTSGSLLKTISQSGGGSAQIVSSPFSNILIATYRTDTTKQSPPDADLAAAHGFRQRAGEAIEAFEKELTKYVSRGQTVGFFVPARAVNMLSMIGMADGDFRFFDDNERLHGTFYPGHAPRVESRTDLLDAPVEVLFVMSLSFGTKIIESLAESLPNTVMIPLSDLVADSSSSMNTSSTSTSSTNTEQETC